MRPHREGAGGRVWRARAAGWRRAAAAEEQEEEEEEAMVMGRPLLRRSAAAEQPLRALKAAEGDSSDDSESAPGAKNAGSGAEEEGADGRGKGCALWQPWRCSDRGVLPHLDGAAAARSEGAGDRIEGYGLCDFSHPTCPGWHGFPFCGKRISSFRIPARSCSCIPSPINSAQRMSSGSTPGFQLEWSVEQKPRGTAFSSS